MLNVFMALCVVSSVPGWLSVCVTQIFLFVMPLHGLCHCASCITQTEFGIADGKSAFMLAVGTNERLILRCLMLNEHYQCVPCTAVWFFAIFPLDSDIMTILFFIFHQTIFYRHFPLFLTDGCRCRFFLHDTKTNTQIVIHKFDKIVCAWHKFSCCGIFKIATKQNTQTR